MQWANEYRRLLLEPDVQELGSPSYQNLMALYLPFIKLITFKVRSSLGGCHTPAPCRVHLSPEQSQRLGCNHTVVTMCSAHSHASHPCAHAPHLQHPELLAHGCMSVAMPDGEGRVSAGGMLSPMVWRLWLAACGSGVEGMVGGGWGVQLAGTAEQVRELRFASMESLESLDALATAPAPGDIMDGPTRSDSQVHSLTCQGWAWIRRRRRLCVFTGRDGGLLYVSVKRRQDQKLELECWFAKCHVSFSMWYFRALIEV